MNWAHVDWTRVGRGVCRCMGLDPDAHAWAWKTGVFPGLRIFNDAGPVRFVPQKQIAKLRDLPRFLMADPAPAP